MDRRIGLLVLAIMMMLSLSSFSYVEASNGTSSLPPFIEEALSNPKVLIAIVIQFLLGLGLGYLSIKIIKYMLALIGIVILGAVLSVWSLGGSINDFLFKMGIESQKLMPVMMGVITTLGILTVGPVAVGFFIGLIIAAVKK